MKKSSKLGQFSLIAFMLGFPMLGLLFFWNDAHAKINRSAVAFVDESFDLFLKSLGDGAPNDDASLAFKESYQAGDYQKIHNYHGHGEIKPLKSWTREENDQMAQYASLEVEANTVDRKQTYTVVIRRLTVAPRWRYHSLSPVGG